MTPTHATLDRIARQLCESRRGTGAYDRKGCRRSIWLRRAALLHARAALALGVRL